MSNPYRESVINVPNMNHVPWPTVPAWAFAVGRYLKHYALGFGLVFGGIAGVFLAVTTATWGVWKLGDFVLTRAGCTMPKADVAGWAWFVGALIVSSAWWMPKLGISWLSRNHGSKDWD